MNQSEPQPNQVAGNQPTQLNIKIEPSVAEGRYSNLAIINHSPAEFILDFTRLLPGLQQASVHTRIIMTPQHTKMLLKALEENVAMYESNHGAIKYDKHSSEKMGFQVSKD
jgi:hypothetical protein